MYFFAEQCNTRGLRRPTAQLRECNPVKVIQLYYNEKEELKLGDLLFCINLNWALKGGVVIKP